MANILSAEQNAQADLQEIQATADKIQTAARQAKRSPNNKTLLSYWRKRIFQPSYVRDGQRIISPNFCIELQHAGERRRWSLGPGTRETAAARARSIFIYLTANGWPATIAKFKPQSAPQSDVTAGAYLEAARRTCDLNPKTFAGYSCALVKICADLGGFSDDRRKFGDGKAHKIWREKVLSIKLSSLTADRIQEWKVAFLSRAGSDPISQRSAKVSVNSFLRCAKSLFSPRIITHVKLELPTPLPFAGCQFEPRPSSKYRSTFDITQLVRTATEALAPTDPEAYKVFLLASMVGLRRKEIDLLEWSAFRWEEGTIRIETTEHFAAKSEDSLGDVAVDPQVMDAFRGYLATSQGAFVIQSSQSPRSVAYNFYRCEEAFGRLIAWLRSQGVRSLKPLHTLRKEFGSAVNATHGIHAASRALRHSAVAVTDQYYTDNRKRVTSGLGVLLESKVVPFQQEVA
jgi:integrase